MSEQIELDGSNLCIPEDAFEKFQAVSMYEETEYITLTNVMPAPTAVNSVGEDTAMTSNIGAMVELNSVDEVHVNTENCDGEQRSPPKAEPAANCDVINTAPLSSGDSNASDVTSKHGKKRGRKKKTISESSDILSENYSECGNILDSTNGPSESIEDIQNFIQTTEPISVPRRRGRRPKSFNISSDELSATTRDLSTENITDTTLPSSSKEPGISSGKRLPKKRGRPAKSHESSLTNISSSNEDEVTVVNYTDQQVLSDTSDSSKKILKKRRRPIKISYEEKSDQIETINTVDDSKSTDVLESLPEAIFITKPKKRGRPKKKNNTDTEPIQDESHNENNLSSHDASLEFDDDDISLSHLSKINNKKTESDEGILNEDKIQLEELLGNDNTVKLEDHENPPGPAKKRGRPKKLQRESPSKVCDKIELQEDNNTNNQSDKEIDDGDDVSLSQFKKILDVSDTVTVAQQDTAETQVTEQPSQPLSPSAQGESSSVKIDDQVQSPGKRNSKMPIMSDFEYNLDSIVSENVESEITDSQKDDANSLLVEDVSRRPTRKKCRQTLQYHEESDEDPFANVELSDDEPRSRKRKGRRYHSDDEYFPGDVQEPPTPSSSDCESNNDLDSDKKSRKRKYSKKFDSQSPRKRGRKPNAEKEITVEAVESSEITVDNVENDIEDCLHSSVIKTNDESAKIWGTTKEFENFLAKKIQGTNLKIKKVSSTENSDVITPLQIPSIDPNEPKKTIEMCTQTTKILTSNVDVQTGGLYDIPMKESISLTAEQSAKACEFLTSIVNTTAELGKLMTQKSEDFIKKKINTDHVTDTFKMDYCVRKSFLLFKLAKHNLTQMEEDLAKQYEQFLREHDLLKHREEPKKIIPTVKADSDSDCEIVEVPVVEEVKKTSKPAKSVPKFNPKTVFLNKELSIKIAKKPSDDKKINIKGKHTVWINDSVMVKKVKPTQSFLAQDSRNKKPPDQNVVTAEMVSDFFEDYYRKKSLATCALFTSPHWLKMNRNYVCNYFVVKQDFTADIDNNETETFALNGANNTTGSTDRNEDINIVKNILQMSETPCPDRLITLCTEVLRKLLPIPNIGINPINDKLLQKEPKSLFELCRDAFNSIVNYTKDSQCSYKNRPTLDTKKQVSIEKSVKSLKTLCHKIVSELFISSVTSYEFIHETQCDDYSATNKDEHNKDEIKTLFSLCVESICGGKDDSNAFIMHTEIKQQKREVKSLFSLCVESIRCASDGSNKSIEPVCLKSKDFEEQILNPKVKQHRREVKSLFSLCFESIPFAGDSSSKYAMHPEIKQYRRCNMTLFSLCVEVIQRIQLAQKSTYKKIYSQITHIKQLPYTPKSLKQICFKNIVALIFNCDDFTRHISHAETTQTLFINNELAEAFTINSVNTLSEEAFHNLQNTVEVPYYEDYDNEDSYSNNDDLEPLYEETEEHGADDNNWASQVQMKELRSCVNINNTADTLIVNGNELSTPLAVTIKSEPIEDMSENVNDSIVVKIEPINELDEMTMIPDSVITKSEVSVSSHVPGNDVHIVNRSYSVDTFEEFVRKNKIIQSLNGNSSEIFSQSSLRVRRQFEPDYDGESEAVDGLLVPHTYTNIYNAKDCLMESSSDEGAEKNNGKKKPAKRKVKSKKPTTKTSNKDIAPLAKEKPKFGTNEVDELTRKMKDRIRQEENQSSDSELENLPVGKRRNRGIVKDTNKKSTDKSSKDAIQCNDVDSTEQVNISHMSSILNDEATNSVCSNSAKPNDSINSKDKMKNNRKKKSRNSGDFEGPMELLECEPTIHEDTDDDFHNAEQLSEPINDTVNSPNNYDVRKPNDTVEDNVPKEPLTDKESLKIVDRCGWSCYPINTKDEKLYQESFVLLYKLPESFVQTYFEYQEITEQNQVDKEIDRLTNVNSLNRISKDKTKIRPRGKVGVAENNKPSQVDASSILESSNAFEQAHEFAPSDDDDANIDDELPPPVPQRHVENTLAKSSLMNDESDDEGRGRSPHTVRTIKKEPTDEAPIRKRPGPKSKTKVEEPRIPDSELVLTADKMMKEELTLLHAPVTLNSIEVNDNVETTHKEPVTRTRNKHPRKVQQRFKTEEDSSSEEEKQWVNTKEKLLKKLNKAPDASVSDAKRAKMVTEFIEKRGEGSETRIVTRGKYRRSRKKFLEREKQLKVLSKELYGESSTDGAYQRKSYSMNYKGRRNIRKVIDKKSLERSTVKAIMEEFERKRRLNDRQNKLREHLGCEENVNVLVINDEVCLEYDFEEDRPAVTVHAFFTKVMKAHQYEGLKFMWDACFESLDKIEAGHPGGGCILAHCMGLGKTLQVLALLHTVLTHPQVGMKRVLVCCPLSTVLNWVDEIHKWIGPVTDQLKVFELSKLKKTYERAYQLEDWYNGGGIFIIGYELFRSLSTLDPSVDDIRPTIIKKIRTALLDPGPDIVVCDEGHLLKNDCSVLAVAMSRVATRRRIVLTGTPMQNNLREYYCMVNFIKPNLLGSYSEYSNRFANPIMNGQHRDSIEEDIKLMKTRTHILHKVLEGCLQRQEASVLYPYLPKKHEYTVFIPLTKCQWDLYKHYLYTYCKQNKQGILKDFHILQKIWSHPQVLHNFHTKLSDYKKKAKDIKLEDDLAAEDLAVDDIKPADTEVWWLQYLEGGDMLESIESSNKFVAVFRILKECVELGDKVLIFSTSLFCLDSLEYFLKKINKWSLGQEYYRLDGSVPPEVRHKWCREFNADNNLKTKLFLISTRAGSLGLNMTAANRVIILDTSWNPAHDMQSIFRVYRFGQKKDCFIYRLVAMGTMEQKIYERSVTKQAVACRVVDEQQIDRHYNSADLAELYRLDEAGGSVEGGVAAGVRDVALLRVARDGPVHAVHEHDSLLRASEPALPEHERAAAWHQFQLERAAEQNKPPAPKKGKMSAKGVQNAKPQTVAEIKSEVNTENDVQEPETSKNKRTDIVKCSIPINKPEFFTHDSLKNDIVTNVIHTLIKHNFPNMQDVNDVTAVVHVVRNIVDNVQADDDNKDMTAGIIAKCMLENKKVRLACMADKVGKNLNANIETALNQLTQLQKPVPIPQKKSARLKERQMRTRNQLKEEANYQHDNDIEQIDKEKMVPSVEPTATITSDIVIDSNEDIEISNQGSSETISADEVIEPEEPPPPNKKKKHKKKIKKSTERVIEQPIISDNSILLSDDDDVSIVQPSPSPVTQRTQNVMNQKTPVQPIQKTPNQISENTPNLITEKTPDQVSQNTPNQARQKNVAEPRASQTSKEKAKRAKTIEPVPLPLSLLTNKHFITIVAHTYLEGNPMLDEDAATLAAQYSTHKAKKEIESGKTITSGPLYDIAVKALTIETLQKLNKVTPKVPSRKIAEASASLLLEASLIDLEPSDNMSIVENPARQLTAAPVPPPKQPSITRNREYTSVLETSRTETYSSMPPLVQTHTVTTAASNVVPVELFKGPSIPSSGQYSRQNNEESILPDDDSSAINVPPPPLHNLVPVDATGSKVILHQRKKSPVILKSMLAKSATRPQPTLIQTTPVNAKISTISAVGGQIVLDPSQLNNTICLDSDEDEPPTPAGPVPVALTRVNAAQPMPVTRVCSGTPGSTPTPGYFIASPAGLSTTTFVNPVATPVNTYVQPVSNTPAMVAISAPINSFAKPPIISAVGSINKPVVGSSPSPHKTTHLELLPKTMPLDETSGKPSQFILKLHNKTLRLVKTDAPPENVKNIVRLGKNDKLIPNADNTDLPVNTKSVKKDHNSYMKSLTAIQPAVGTEPSVTTEHVKKNQSSVLKGSSMKTLVLTKPAPTKVDSKKAIKLSESRRVLTVRSSKDSDSSNTSHSDKREDPLDILKDIVHIQAYDTENTSQNVNSSNNKGKSSHDVTPSTTKGTSIADEKSAQYKIKSFKEMKPSFNTDKDRVEVKTHGLRKIAPKPSGTDLRLSFSKETVDSLSNILAKKKATLQAESFSITSWKKDTVKAKEVLNIKLDKQQSKNNVKAAGSFIDLTSNNHPGPSNSKDSKSSNKQSTSTFTGSKRDKIKPKVVNLTKNIVAIEKPVIKFAKDTNATVDITGESSKSKPSTKLKSTVQQTSFNDKKRSSTTVDTKPPKKKKLEELTLQDFDIDDLDDIIELE